MAETISRGLAVDNPHALQSLLYPLYSGVHQYANDHGIPMKGTYTLTLTFVPEEQ